LKNRIRCECGWVGGVDESLAGGFTNCGACGRAVAVPGFRDPWWRVLQVAAAVAIVAGTALAWGAAGPVAGVAAGATLALVAWLVSKAM
jgi:hypothetical protein